MKATYRNNRPRREQEEDQVRAKKHLGQHFLKDLSIAEKIANALTFQGYSAALEVGPGMGVLTQYLVTRPETNLQVAEIDSESIVYLKKHFPQLEGKILEGDFLRYDLGRVMQEPFGLIGNFPYNISSQIFFKVLEHKDLIPEVVGMLQKEVADRFCAPPGSKTYGILSVLLQTYYDIEYLFTVHEHVFNPPPKVKSAVIRLKRNSRAGLPLNERRFQIIVKQAFNNRRKTLRNALKPLILPNVSTSSKYFDLRAEQLSVDEFIELALILEAKD